MSNVKNYTEQGGEKTVIGGTLEIADGGKLIIGGSEVTRAETQADSAADTVTALMDDFNTLLAKLKTAGLMANS